MLNDSIRHAALKRTTVLQRNKVANTEGSTIHLPDSEQTGPAGQYQKH